MTERDPEPQALQAAQRVAVARIRAPHGVTGEVRVEVLSDDPGRLQTVRECFLRLPRGQVVPLEVVQARPGPGGTAIARFRGVDSRAAAEALRGALVEIAREAVRPLPEGRIYLFELIGMEVVTGQGQRVGVVSGVLRSPAHDIWEITGPRGRPVLLPAVRAFVQSVDPAQRRVVVRLPEGLLS